MGGNQGGFFAQMKPRAERKLSVDQIIAELRPKVAAVPGIMVFMQNPPPITVSGQFSTSIYQMTMQSANLKEIYAWVDPLMQKMRTLPGFLDVNSDLQIAQPAGDGGYRSRSRHGAGFIAATDRRRAVHGLRHPAGLHDLYAGQSVCRHPAG